MQDVRSEDNERRTARLKVPHEKFYNGELTPNADPAIIYSMQRSDQLPKPNFPVVFHAVVGKDMRESTSPSFFNVEEASIVKRYVQDLKSDQRLRLSECIDPINRLGIAFLIP